MNENDVIIGAIAYIFDGAINKISNRDQVYLDMYYDAVSILAHQYHVNPELVLGVGIDAKSR